MTYLAQGKHTEAVDHLAQRILEVLLAKRAGDSWCKGELLSLLPSDQAPSAQMSEGTIAL